MPDAGDPIPKGSEIIEVHVGELSQLFNAMDPSPFRERDLDTDAEEFIVGAAREASRGARFALVVHLDRAPGVPDEPAALRGAIREFFTTRADVTIRRLRQLLRIGRTSLLIGLVFLTAGIVVGDVIARSIDDKGIGNLLRESLLIGGWVAMWRPVEIFLYGWWPIRSEARLYRRLAEMPVRIVYVNAGGPEAWRGDWPAVPARDAQRRAPPPPPPPSPPPDTALRGP